MTKQLVYRRYIIQDQDDNSGCKLVSKVDVFFFQGNPPEIPSFESMYSFLKMGILQLVMLVFRGVIPALSRWLHAT